MPLARPSKALGVSITTLRRWEAEGKLIPERTVAGHRRYDLAKLKPEIFHNDAAEWRTVAYARVSSHDQKDDLERQKQVAGTVLRPPRLDVRSDRRPWDPA